MEFQRQSLQNRGSQRLDSRTLLSGQSGDRRISLRQPLPPEVEPRLVRATLQPQRHLGMVEKKPGERSLHKIPAEKHKLVELKKDQKDCSLDLAGIDRHQPIIGSKSVYEEIIHGRKGQQLIKAERGTRDPTHSLQAKSVERKRESLCITIPSHQAHIPQKSLTYAGGGESTQPSGRTIIVESNRGIIETCGMPFAQSKIKTSVYNQENRPPESEEVPRSTTEFLTKGTQHDKKTIKQSNPSERVLSMIENNIPSIRESFDLNEKHSVTYYKGISTPLAATPPKGKTQSPEETEFTPGGRDLSPAGKLLENPEALELKFVKIAEEVKKGLAYLIESKKPDRAPDDWPEPSERGISEADSLKGLIKELELENKEKDVEILNLCVQLQDTSKIMRSLFRKLRSRK